MALKNEQLDEQLETPAEVTKAKTKAQVTADNDGIEVNDPMDLRPVELPLVIKLPEGASKAQIAFAKTLNAYAYQNPTKWAQKKDDRIENGTVVKGLITQLKELKSAPDPIESNIKINKSSI